MKDLIHTPVPWDDLYQCERCGVAIPTQAVLLASGDVVDIAGLHETFLPMEASSPAASILCSHPAAKKAAELAAAIHESDDVIRLADEQERGNKPGGDFNRSDMERMVVRQGYANFWGHRDLTRPEDYNEVT
jgi:hypothetical protein